MGQGVPAVKWTQENNNKLLQAMAIMHNGSTDYKELAAVFGPDVPATAIRSRLSALRKEGAALGLVDPKSSPFKSSAVKNENRVGGETGEKAKGKTRARGGIVSDHASDDETMGPSDTDAGVRVPKHPNTAGYLTTPTPSAKREKTIGGRVRKARMSPRKKTKKDYKALKDPFAKVDLTDGEGQKIFQSEKSDSEDTSPTDEEFGGGKQDDVVPVEETT